MLAARASSRDSILCPLGDQPSFEMRDRAEDMEDQLAGGRSGVDLLLKTDQGDAARLEQGDGCQQLAERAPEALKANDRQRVTVAGISKQRLQPGPLHRPAGADIGEHLDGAGLGQPHGLSGDILIAGRHPRVAEDAVHSVSQTTVLWTGCRAVFSTPARPSTKYVR